MGVLNAAANAPAAPIGTRSLTRAGDNFSHWPMTGADTEHAGQKLPDWHARWDMTLVKMKRGFRLRHAAAAHAVEHAREQHTGDDADQRWNEEGPRRRRYQSEQQVVRSLDPQAE
jgi:hypothetical protein